MNRRKLFKLTGAAVGATALEAVGIKPPEPVMWVNPEWEKAPYEVVGWFKVGSFGYFFPCVNNSLLPNFSIHDKETWPRMNKVEIPPHNEETIIL